MKAHIAIPDFNSGAMENWGLITYRESSLLFNPATDTISNMRRVSVVVSHELAHQWVEKTYIFGILFSSFLLLLSKIYRNSF